MSNLLLRCRRARWMALALFLSLSWGAAYGQFTPSDDAYTDTAAPAMNLGNKPTLGLISPSQTTYITFDLSAIPAGYTSANIAKASLKLYVNSVTTAGSFNVDFVNGAWSEKTITANAAPALGSTIAASVPLTKASFHDYILIDVTAAVAAWLDGTQANNGLALVANSPLSATFDSKESTTQSHPPELDVVFSGGTITGVLTAAGSGLTGGGTSGTLNLSMLTSCATGQVLQWNGASWVCSNAGSGTITGVTAGTGLTGGGNNGNVSLSLDTTKVPLLTAANTFSGNQTVNGNLSATGLVTGSGYQIGSNLFAFGSFSSGNAFLGYGGNISTSGIYNTAVGNSAFVSNTLGSQNTAVGSGAMYTNTEGFYNTALGNGALFYNSSGSGNVAVGQGAL